MDRAVDIVIAAVLQRRQMLAAGSMDVEGSSAAAAASRPVDMSGAVTVVSGEGHAESSATKVPENDPEDPGIAAAPSSADIEAIEEALAASVSMCREVYTGAVSALVAASSHRYNTLTRGDSASQDESLTLPHLDPQFICMLSLLKRTLRIFHGTERELRRLGAVEHWEEMLVLCDLDSALSRVHEGRVPGLMGEFAKDIPETVRVCLTRRC